MSAQFAAEAFRLLELQPGERVIDVAAGTGAFSLMAARSGVEVLATDFASGMIDRLRARAASAGLTGITAEVMDGQALHVPDASFDASVSVLGLIFFPDIPKGIGELRRVLRPGGRGAIVCWNDPRTLRLMTLLRGALEKVVPGFQPPTGPPVWARLAGPDSLRAQMEAAGFRDVRTTAPIAELRVDSPETFWTSFTSSAPPLAYLFSQLEPAEVAAVGHEYMQTLRESSADGIPTIRVEGCLGIGRAYELSAH